MIKSKKKYHVSENNNNALYNPIKDEKIDSLMLHIENTMLPKLFKNISKFRPGQRQVVENILQAKSTLAILPTGAGKSLCYMLPSQLLEGITIVVSPLLAMMRDQVNILHEQGIAAARLDSSMNIDEIRKTILDISLDKIKILYVSPERFNNESFRKLILNKRVSMFVVDEAHCISEWGHAFRPDYLRLSHFASISKAQVKLAVTATATKRVADDISSRLGIDTNNIVRLPSVRKNLNLKVVSLLRPHDDYNVRRVQIIENLKLFYNNNSGSIIIYVSRQKLADRLASDLIDQGFNARAYHAGLKTDEREKIESWFLNNYSSNDINKELNFVNPIVVGTIAFGMGIDCNSVRYIFHFDLPRSIEDYVQGIGRAGRDDKESYCLAFLAQSDIPAIKNQIYGLTPQYNYIKKFTDSIFDISKGFPSSVDVNVMYISYYDLSYECDINELQLRLMMAKLIQNNIVTELTPLYGIFKVSIIDHDKLKSFILSPSLSDSTDFSIIVDDDNIEYYDINENNDDNYINILQDNNMNNNDGLVKISKNRMLLCEKIGKYMMEQSIKFPRRKWIELNTIDLANEYLVTPKEVISAISVFISTKICNNGGLTKVYNRFKLHNSINNHDIITMLTTSSIENQKRSLVRIDEIVSLLIKGTCSNKSNDIWTYVGKYFEDDIKIKEKKSDVEKILKLSNQMIDTNISMDEIEWQKIINLVSNKILPIDDPYHIARFATGVISPRIIKQKLSKYDEFGNLMHCNWNDVIDKCIELCNIAK